MSVGGLKPLPDDDGQSIRVSHERLAEFDQLMAEGGIEAVLKALEKQEICKIAA